MAMRFRVGASGEAGDSGVENPLDREGDMDSLPKMGNGLFRPRSRKRVTRGKAADVPAQPSANIPYDGSEAAPLLPPRSRSGGIPPTGNDDILSEQERAELAIGLANTLGISSRDAAGGPSPGEVVNGAVRRRIGTVQRVLDTVGMRRMSAPAAARTPPPPASKVPRTEQMPGTLGATKTVQMS